MKKYCLFAILTLFFASCRTDVDLYIENDDTTIVYTILDTNADTNFFKVSKSSLHGDYYYDKDDIDVYFAGRFKDENNVDTLKLELVTKMEDKRLQSFYFTTRLTAFIKKSITAETSDPIVRASTERQVL